MRQDSSGSLSRYSDFSDKRIIKSSDSKKEELLEQDTGPYQTMCKTNGKVAEDSASIKEHNF